MKIAFFRITVYGTDGYEKDNLLFLKVQENGREAIKSPLIKRG